MSIASKTILTHCPFCGSHGNRLNVFQNDDFVSWSVSCYDCHCSGPEAETKREAVNLWQKRFDEWEVCPFCSSTNVLVDVVYEGYAVVCIDCWSHGPCCHQIKDAEWDWKWRSDKTDKES